MEVRGRGLPLCPTKHHSEGIVGGKTNMRKLSLNQTNNAIPTSASANVYFCGSFALSPAAPVATVAA